jgi:hypothetical protein
MSLTKFVMQPTLHLHLLCGLKKKQWGTCIVGCITNFVRLMITRESPCKIIKRTGTFF